MPHARKTFRLVTVLALTWLLAACGGTDQQPAEDPAQSATSSPPVEATDELCDNLSRFLDTADQLADGSMAEALEGLPEDTAVTRARDAVGGMGVLGQLLSGDMPEDLQPDMDLIVDTAIEVDEYLAEGGDPAGMSDYIGEDYEQARQDVRAYLENDSDC